MNKLLLIVSMVAAVMLSGCVDNSVPPGATMVQGQTEQALEVPIILTFPCDQDDVSLYALDGKTLIAEGISKDNFVTLNRPLTNGHSYHFIAYNENSGLMDFVYELRYNLRPNVNIKQESVFGDISSEVNISYNITELNYVADYAINMPWTSPHIYIETMELGLNNSITNGGIEIEYLDDIEQVRYLTNVSGIIFKDIHGDKILNSGQTYTDYIDNSYGSKEVYLSINSSVHNSGYIDICADTLSYIHQSKLISMTHGSIDPITKCYRFWVNR